MIRRRLTPFVQIGVLALALLILGARHFMQTSPAEQRETELEAALEQLYHMEAAYYEQHGRYFNPTAPAEGLQWKWMQAYAWEFHASNGSFWLMAKADLDGDGLQGVWGVDARGPQARRLMED